MAPLTEDNIGDDAQLVVRFQNGDPTAFEHLVRKYQDRVVNICTRMVANRDCAADIAQETFLKVFQALPQFEHKSRFYTWLFRVTVNQCISFRRKEQRLKVYSLNALTAETAAAGADQQANALRLRVGTEPAESANPLDSLRKQELQQVVADALAELDEDHRVILVLRDVESLDYAAISQILEVPLGTVRSRLHRARLALREKIKPVWEKAG